MEVRLEAFCEAEMDEQWSYVGKKSEQRWLWYAIDHASSTLLAYVFGRRKDDVFQQLQLLLQPFNITRYYTDDWGLMSVIYPQISMKWVKKTPRK
jgi:IS1 family transposase